MNFLVKGHISAKTHCMRAWSTLELRTLRQQPTPPNMYFCVWCSVNRYRVSSRKLKKHRHLSVDLRRTQGSLVQLIYVTQIFSLTESGIYFPAKNRHCSDACAF